MSTVAIPPSIQRESQHPIQSEPQDQPCTDTSEFPTPRFCIPESHVTPQADPAQTQLSKPINKPPSTTTLLDKSDNPSNRALVSTQAWTSPSNRNWSPLFPLDPPKRELLSILHRCAVNPPKPISLAHDIPFGKPNLAGLCVNDYEIIRVISTEGFHGLVVLARQKDKRDCYAMKIERSPGCMNDEGKKYSKIYEKLKDLPLEDIRVPRLYATMKEFAKEFIVMEVLGPSLADLRDATGQTCSDRHEPWSMKTSLEVGLELLATYEQLHSARWIHLSTKPANFCIGGTPLTKGRIYAVDFGRARAFVRSDNTHVGEYNLCQQVRSEYASIWNEKNLAGSRRDDLMSLTLMLIDLAYGGVPWEHRRKEVSKSTWIEAVVKGQRTKGLAPFETMLAYIAALGYVDCPDYGMLNGVLKGYAVRKGIELDGRFDWDDLLDVNAEGFVVLQKKKGENKRRRWSQYDSE